MFLPWVNHIYILMNPPKKYPSWMKKCNYITIIDHNDVMRHPLVSKIVKAYDDYEKKEPNGKS